MKQTVDCEYFNHGSLPFSCDFYECRIQGQIIVDSNNSEYEFRGEHKYKKTNQDVVMINFVNCKISRIPQNLTKVFPNATFLQLFDCELKSLKREDLKEYSKLTDLKIVHNEIPFLPGDLLADMKDLIGVWLHDNKTQIIEPNLLDGLINLKTCDLSNNLCINMCYDDSQNEGYVTLDKIKTEIATTYLNSPWKKIFENIAEKPTNKVVKDLEKIIQNDDFKDFTIMVDGQEFKAHKLVLAARSQVLAETIQSDIHAEYLNLNDISCEIFREILNFIYTDELPKVNKIDFIKIYIAASRLKLTKLKDFASEKLIEMVNDKNALDFLELANKFQNQKLKQKSFGEIKKLLKEMQVDESLAENVEKLRKVLKLKKQKEELIKAIDNEMMQALTVQ